MTEQLGQLKMEEALEQIEQQTLAQAKMEAENVKMDKALIQAVVESVLFVAGEPVDIQELANVLSIDRATMEKELNDMKKAFKKRRSGLVLHTYGGHVQLRTQLECAPYIERILQPVQKQSLSQSALETLAIIAQHQPVTRLEMEQIRGVKCDYSVQSLLQKGLIEDLGRKEVIGRPILYGTTDTFLKHFGISSLSELPLRDLSKEEEERE